MVAIEQLVVGTVIAVLALVIVWRLSSALKALIALWRRPQATETDITPGETISVEGETFVEEPAIATDRLFDNAPQTIGSYVWRAAFTSAGGYTYDFERGEFRTVRRSFASGIETGRFGVSIGSKDVYVDPSWLRRAYNAGPLSEVTIGEHRSNVSLPLGLSQRLFGSPYLNLTCTLRRIYSALVNKDMADIEDGCLMRRQLCSSRSSLKSPGYSACELTETPLRHN